MQQINYKVNEGVSESIRIHPSLYKLWLCYTCMIDPNGKMHCSVTQSPEVIDPCTGLQRHGVSVEPLSNPPALTPRPFLPRELQR